MAKSTYTKLPFLQHLNIDEQKIHHGLFKFHIIRKEDPDIYILFKQHIFYPVV